MLNPRWHKVIHDLWGAKACAVIVVLSIAVGVLPSAPSPARVILTRDLS
jgi:hypothetical protein